MRKIKELDSQLINLIAAGEVVERPASVLKELIENSIDAGATVINIYLEDGGKKLLKISDNGHGIPADEVELAFTKHATSKIYSTAELDAIITFGFRGEALASITSVAEVECITSTTIETTTTKWSGSKLIDKSVNTNTSGKTGTTISVNNLFDNTPARQKFLKTTATEYRNCYNALTSLALPNPKVDFNLYHNGELQLRLPASDNLSDRINDIFSSNVTKDVFAVISKHSGIEVSGFIGKPELARQDTKLQYIFVNNRAIQDQTIKASINKAFTGFIHRDLRPSYFLFLNIDLDKVDVNVHPRKQEVRFSEPGIIFSAIYRTVLDTLNTQTASDLRARIPSFDIEALPTDTTLPVHSGEVEHNTPNILSFTSQPSRNISGGFKSSAKVSQALDFSAQILSSPSLIDIKQAIDPATAATSNSIQPDNLLQLFNTYIVYQLSAHEMIFVDQHAAAEKILYERVRKQYGQGLISKPMLIPAVLELDHEIIDTLIANPEAIERWGFNISQIGDSHLQIIASPEILDKESELSRVLTDIAEALKMGYTSKESATIDRLFATVACHGAIRAGQKLTVAEMKSLLSDLAKCEDPYNCPHGRPVSVVMHIDDLAKLFKRII